MMRPDVARIIDAELVAPIFVDWKRKDIWLIDCKWDLNVPQVVKCVLLASRRPLQTDLFKENHILTISKAKMKYPKLDQSYGIVSDTRPFRCTSYEAIQGRSASQGMVRR
jgi:hypothetical protein